MLERLPHADTGQGAQSEAALRFSELHFRRLLEKLPAGAYTCDSEGLITYFNQHAVRLWGRAPKLNDPVDRFCGSFKLFSVEGVPITHDECWMALAIKMNREYNGHEIIIERPDGERITALAHANPIHDDAGNLIGAVNVLVDITDRKRAEDELKEADRTKNEFIATLAHELRNPLAPIRNAVGVLSLQGSSSPETRWAVEVIERQMRQMTRLIDDLLDLARVTRNRLELRRERVELTDVMRSAIETSRPLIEACGQEFIVDFPHQPVYCDGDLVRLAQVVSNLLNNAAKYTARGRCIWLSGEAHAREAVVTVRDSGVGIPRELLPRIFDMFTQADHSLERSQGGLGIGLTLAKRLVEMHGGSLEAHSDGPGTGSTFIIRLPLAVRPEDSRAADNGDARPASAVRRRILVVDDNQDCAETLGMLLKLIGNEVRLAYDGHEALSLIEEYRPDMVFLDIGMPQMNGYEVAHHIRQRLDGEGPILVALTGWGQDEDRRRAHEAGFDHHMTKPVEIESLQKLLADAGASDTEPSA